MEIKIRNSRDFCAGLIFSSFGMAALFIGGSYPMGSSSSMGPGYFPVLLGGILTLLGIIIASRGFWGLGVPIGAWPIRQLIFILGSVLGFALLVRPFGLVLAIIVLVLASSMSRSDFSLREAICLLLVLVALGVGLFVYGLGLPFNIWHQ